MSQQNDMKQDNSDIHTGWGSSDMILPDVHNGDMGSHNVAFGLGGKSNYTIDTKI